MPAPESERPILIVQDGDKLNQRWTMFKDEVVLGRGEECDITLGERQISRQHIRIYKENSSYFIQDLDSKNGTWVNGQPLRGFRELRDGDEIQVALTVRIQFIGSDSTSPLMFEQPRHEEGLLRLDREARRVFIGETEIVPPLSLPQYRLLELLYDSVGHICTRDTVVETVWPEAMGEGVSEQAIDALVRRLRDRIAEVDPDRQYIVTVRGHGFRLDRG